MKRRFLTVALLVALLFGVCGCPHAPVRSSEMQAKLLWLEQHGYTDDEVDLPKSCWLALVLDILPIPGVGHYYVGDIGDGIKTTLLCWTVAHWIMGPIDAWKEASYKNDVMFIAHAERHGWFEHPEGPGGTGPATKRPEFPSSENAASGRRSRNEKDRPPPADDGRDRARDTPPPSRGGESAFCADCGRKFEGNFCGACGARRR